MVFSVIGGDIRQEFIVRKLKEKRCEVRMCNSICCLEEALKGADVIILPLPASTDGKTIKGTEILINEFFEYITSEMIIFGGNVSAEINAMSPCSIVDFYKSEKLKAVNAYLTAEGAISLIINGTKKSLKDCKILITGFGRISKCVAYLLKAFAGDVTVALRSRKDMALVEGLGFEIIDVSGIDSLESFDVIVNTVPSRILDNVLHTAKKDSYILELASLPYGFDTKKAEELKLNFEIGSSLPGKISPESAGDAILKCILRHLKL